MDKIKEFIAASTDEMKTKVSWPTYGELQNNSIIVLVASLIFAVIIGVMDFGFKNLMEVLYSL